MENTHGGRNNLEYLCIHAPADMRKTYIDGYRSFGWELENADAQEDRLCFRRAAKLCNRTELTRLQRQFSGIAAEIRAMRRAGASRAENGGLLTGTVGAWMLACTVLFYAAGMTSLSQAALAMGITCAALAYPVYRLLSRRLETHYEPYLAMRYEDLDTVCKKALALL